MYNPEDDGYITKLMIKEVSKTKLLTREEERYLLTTYATASPQLKSIITEKIVSANLRFALKVALFYHRKTGIDLNDLMSECKMGLIKSVELYNIDKQVKFISFAVWYVRCHVTKYLESTDMIRLPSHQRIKLNQLRKNGELKNDEDMRMLNEIVKETLSFDSPYGDSDELTLGDSIKDESIPDPHIELTKENLQSQLNDAIEILLDPEERAIIKNIFGMDGSEPMNLQDSHELFGKSSERIRHLRNRALKKLSKSPKIKQMYAIMNSMYE